MKPLIVFHIQKFTKPQVGKGEWEYWDGPHRTEKIARKEFDKTYRNKGREKKQDFRIIKTTTELVPFVFKEIEDDT
jgi:hypothetical protein